MRLVLSGSKFAHCRNPKFLRLLVSKSKCTVLNENQSNPHLLPNVSPFAAIQFQCLAVWKGRREAKLKMASVELDVRAGESEVEPPRKRQRLSPTPTSKTAAEAKGKMDDRSSRLENSGEISDGREAEVGILHFVNSSNPGFSGVLKHRYVNCSFSLHPFRYAWFFLALLASSNCSIISLKLREPMFER